MDQLHTAIAGKQKVTFQYFDYTPEKKKIHRHNGQQYIVSPYAMLWSNDLYYMVGYSDAKEWVLVFSWRATTITAFSGRCKATP